jgi:predicted transcriptional regulator
MTQKIQDDSEIKPPSMPSSLEILELQESRPGIFRTYKAIQKKDDWVKSTDIAKETKRSRGLESRYLNYLSKKGFVLKKREKTDPDSRATEVWYKIIGVNG